MSHGILSENQKLLTSYLAAVGCQKVAVLYMMTALWDERATLEMLQFCADNPKAAERELVAAAERISKKYEPANAEE